MKLRITNKHYFDENGKPVFLVGPDSPENFLAGFNFDGHGGHTAAIDYLASKGVNSISMLTNNWQGDGKDVFPWVTYEMGDPNAMGRVYDLAKIGSWRQIVSYANSKGIHVIVKLWENENQDEWGVLNDRTKEYFNHMMVAFGDLSVTFVLGEENRLPVDEQRKVVQYFRSMEVSNISIHNWPSDWKRQRDQLKDYIDVFSLQADISDGNDKLRTYEKAVSWDEQGPWQTGISADDLGIAQAIYTVMWPTLFGGGAGCSFYFGSPASNPNTNDLYVKTYEVFDEMWNLVGRMQRAIAETGFDFTKIVETGSYKSCMYGTDASGVSLVVGSREHASEIMVSFDWEEGDVYSGDIVITGSEERVFIPSEGTIVKVPMLFIDSVSDDNWVRQGAGTLTYRPEGNDPSATYGPIYAFEVKMKPGKAGSYRFFMESIIGDRIAPFTDFNDCYISVSKAVRFVDLEPNGPKPIGGTVGPDNWIKVYTNRPGNAPSWETHTIDEDPHAIIVDVENDDEVITVAIAGRSENFTLIHMALAPAGTQEWQVGRALDAIVEVVQQPAPTPTPQPTPVEPDATGITSIEFEEPVDVFIDGAKIIIKKAQ